MVEYFGSGAQILGVKDECNEKDESLDKSFHDSHMRRDDFKEPCLFKSV